IAVRWLLRAPGLEGFDSVGFAAALTSYDLVNRTPHFPGYPIYILAAKLFFALGASSVDALILPGVLGAALLTLSLAHAAHELAGERAALVAALLSIVMPALHLAGVRPLSEGIGVALLALACAAAVTTWK